jgi:endo-1,4-beta-xylanase
MLMALKAIKINNKPIIDGVGLQFHINYGTKTGDTPENASGNIEYAIRKMASTGLLVHIAELDVSIASKNDGSTLDQRKSGQNYRYFYVPQMYRRVVPDWQRWGITLWNVGDNDSWLGTTAAPTVFAGAEYTKKYTYERFYDGLKDAITIP